MIVHKAQQGTHEWNVARQGLPTASELNRAVTSKFELSTARHTYRNVLIAQSFDPNYGLMEEIASKAVIRGSELEPEARRAYEFETNTEVQQVGFCTDDEKTWGASPDGLVGDDGCIEIKCPLAENHIAWLLAGTVPSRHLVQCHAVMAVCERKWCDFYAYHPHYPALKVRLHRNEQTDVLRVLVKKFIGEINEAIEKIQAMRLEPMPVRTLDYGSMGTVDVTAGEESPF